MVVFLCLFFRLGVVYLSKMTVKQRKFADEYIISGNATEAAIKAGYSEKTARFTGAENLTKPNIKNYIDERMKELEAESIASQTEVLQYLSSVMRGETTVQVLRLCGEGVQEVVDIAPSEKDRLKAAELLGKRYQLFTDKVDLNSNVGVTIIDDIS